MEIVKKTWGGAMVTFLFFDLNKQSLNEGGRGLSDNGNLGNFLAFT